MADDEPAVRAAQTFEALTTGSALQHPQQVVGSPYVVAVTELRESLALCRYTGSPADEARSRCSPAGRRRARASLEGFLHGLGAYHRHRRSALNGREPVGFESAVVFPHGRGGDVYFDDNTWIEPPRCAFTTEFSGMVAPSNSAVRYCVLQPGRAGRPTWRGSHPGGIRWKVPASNTSRHTCSNAPVAELAALVAMRDGDNAALDWSRRIYAWVHGTLRGADGLYLDQIAQDGTVLPKVWNYNQGTMIGAGVLLHQATGDGDYLEQARSTARAALEHFSLERLVDQGASFNAVFFRNLLLLDEVEPNPAYRRLARTYADRMWNQRRNPTTGLFSSGSSFLNNTAPMMEIYALLAGSRPHA